MMMTEKIWKYRYVDTTIIRTIEDKLMGNYTLTSAEHHPGWFAPMHPDPLDPELCYIYSNKAVPNCILVDRNVEIGG